jgi:hypothetical protein
MPRPKDGYQNAAGQAVPGVHDITSRYKETGGLLNWAYSQGKKGVPLYQANVLQIGHAVHRMAELDLRGAPTDEVETVPYQMLGLAEDIDKAFAAFREYLHWRKDHCVRALAFEEALVSELHQVGGTPDTIALVDGDRALLDFKTSKTASDIYLDQRLAMAAHGCLWHENHPDLPLAGYHLIILPKDGSRFGHHAFADLSLELEMFLLQLDCWRIERGLQRKRTKRAPSVSQAKETAQAAPVAAPKARGTRKPAIELTPEPLQPMPMQPMAPPPPRVEILQPAKPAALGLRPQTMAEILRANGLVPAL